MFDFLSKKSVQFSQVSQAEDCESLISDQIDPEKPQLSRESFSIKWCLVGIITTFLIATPLGAWIGSHWFSNADLFCIKHVSQYSPVTEDVQISYQSVQFNGSLLKENVFRQSAGPEVDAAWESLGVDYRSAIVPSGLGQKAGLCPDHVQVSDRYGGGFPANVEGLHHLHCLNLLRQSLYYNFDYYHARGEGAFVNSDEILRFHVSHCLDILRQQLMCTADIAVLGQVWWNKEEPTAYPDFNTAHKCKNFDDVRQWAKEHQAPAEVPQDYLKPPASLNVVYETIP